MYYSDAKFTNAYTAENAAARIYPYQNMDKKGFRLPTEAEWEWAAKGGTEDKWAGTNELSELKKYAWTLSNAAGKTHEVKKLQKNGYGLFDMSGNVWELCWDWYDSTIPTEGRTNPTGMPEGYGHVRRGGCWLDNDECSGRAYRNGTGTDPVFKYEYVGLRIVSRP